MNAFTVTYARVNDREAMQGGTSRHGVEATGLTLRDALETARGIPSRASDSRGVWASDSDPRRAAWVTSESVEFDSGDSVETEIHFPDNATPSSRARLVRLLTESRRHRLS